MIAALLFRRYANRFVPLPSENQKTFGWLGLEPYHVGFVYQSFFDSPHYDVWFQNWIAKSESKLATFPLLIEDVSVLLGAKMLEMTRVRVNPIMFFGNGQEGASQITRIEIAKFVCRR
jgi:hypothetical protein